MPIYCSARSQGCRLVGPSGLSFRAWALRSRRHCQCLTLCSCLKHQHGPIRSSIRKLMCAGPRVMSRSVSAYSISSCRHPACMLRARSGRRRRSAAFDASPLFNDRHWEFAKLTRVYTGDIEETCRSQAGRASR